MYWWLPLVVAVIFPNIGGIVGSFFTRKSIPVWYKKELVKPGWRPPNWAFGPVWTYLYSSMGYSAYRVWHQLGRPDLLLPLALPTPLLMFIAQLILNWAWTPIFFGMKHLTLALIEIMVLWLAVAVTTLQFYEVDQLAGLLFVPYMTWLTLATALTISIWKANPRWRFGVTSQKKH